MKTAGILEIDGKEVKVSNPEKIYYPQTGFTKGDVLKYYIDIAPAILPHLKDRPLSFKRYPEGVEGLSFFEKNCPAHRPDWVQTTAVWSSQKQSNINYCVVNDLAALIWSANLGVLEFHTSLSKKDQIESPTVMVYDLDPGEGTTIVECCQVALWIRDALESAGFECFPKTSGSKGLQLYMPLNSNVHYDQTKSLSHELAIAMERAHPDKIVSKMSKILRTGKIFIDWSQNDQTKTTVCAYSTRAKSMESASTPVKWDEVRTALKKRSPELLKFTPAQVVKRFEKFGDLFEPIVNKKQRITAKTSLTAQLPITVSPIVPEAVIPALDEYKAKRDFSVSPEPSGKAGRSRGRKSKLSFCVQMHLASHLHFDFRLEHNGVMLSWAVPKGPSLNPADKRLAMQTEDHPKEYTKFEGVIPEGYGAGIVMLWDYGTWEPLGDIEEGLKKGHLKFNLNGVKLKGSWTLARSGKPFGSKPQWLLIKHADEWSGELDILTFAPLSVKSDQDFKGILSKGYPENWKQNPPAKGGEAGKMYADLLAQVKPKKPSKKQVWISNK